MYTGKTIEAEAKPQLLMSGNVVCRLTQSLPKNVNHKVFFYNFFSTIAIMNHLKKRFLAEKELKKKGCGYFDFVVEANSGVTVIHWFDNGLVQLLSKYARLLYKQNVGPGRKGGSSTSIGQQWLSSTTATWMLSTCVTH